MSIADAVAWVRTAREAIRDDIELLIDANCAYRASGAFGSPSGWRNSGPYQFEEPVQPDDYDGFRTVSETTWIGQAAGENEYTKCGFRDVIATRAIACSIPTRVTPAAPPSS